MLRTKKDTKNRMFASANFAICQMTQRRWNATFSDND